MKHRFDETLYEDNLNYKTIPGQIFLQMMRFELQVSTTTCANVKMKELQNKTKKKESASRTNPPLFKNV